MNRTEPEELLRALADLEEESGDAAPSDERLSAYRVGSLPADEAERLEALLADHPEARERLAAQAGVELPRPSERMRATVLAAAPRRSSPGRWGDWRGWAAAAGIVLAVAALAFFLRPGPSKPLPVYEVALTGIAIERSAPAPSSARVDARRETRISIAVTPLDRGIEGVEFGLYHRWADRLDRLSAGGSIRLVENGGAAGFEATAEALVGSAAGEHEIYVVVALRGDLPSGRRLQGSEEEVVAWLAEGGARRVYPLRIHLLPSR